MLSKNLPLSKKNDPLREDFQNFVPKGFITSQMHVLCVNFVKFGRPEIGKIVRYLRNKKNKISARSLALASARIAPKICQDKRQTMCSKCPKFHPNRFTTSGLIAERVNTVQTRHKVFPILGEATASSPSNKSHIKVESSQRLQASIIFSPSSSIPYFATLNRVKIEI